MKEIRDSISVYVHVPFCKSKCEYCSFVSGVFPEQIMNRYFESLSKEVDSFFSDSGKSYHVPTLYIGGGTPSAVPGNLLISVIENLFFKIDDKPSEITIEANPGDVNTAFIQSIKQIGVNRISLGAQSFNDDVLRFLGRRHNASQILESFAILREYGFQNISIDLMHGIPIFGMNRWIDDLNTVISLSPEHISLYALSVEEGTSFWKRGIGTKLNPDHTADEYHTAVKMLRNSGYIRYEISNFAKPGMECLHNLNYWTLDDYVGFGASAASYIDSVYNERNHDIFKYISNIENGISTFEHEEHFHGRDKWVNAFIMGMRLEKGIEFAEFKIRFGVDISSEVQNAWKDFIDGSRVIIDSERVKFGDEGIYVSNSLLSTLV